MTARLGWATPSPPRCARHLSPALPGRGSRVCDWPFARPREAGERWPAQRDGEGAFWTLSKRAAFAALATILLATSVTPTAAAKIDDQFQAWLTGDLWPEASRQGISRKIFDAAFAGVGINLDLPDLVMPGQKPKTPKKQHQAEFGSPGSYFSKIGGVTSGGRTRFNANAATLRELEKRFGVPGEIAVAIWGRESGFGTAKIPHDAFQVMATKAFLATRKEMFRKEVLAALQMLEQGRVARPAFKSSWAGALGQPQFMPTSFLAHAIDFDGDGSADIWKSTSDTLGSIANYLAHFGWQKGRDWGFEVTVPQTVSCALEGPDQGKKIADWTKLGVARVGGKLFPAHELRSEGFLLMPAGRSGPSFIVTPNFYVLKAYNESDLYALFIGHAADRIAHGDKPFAGAWGAVGGLYRSDVASLQRGLEKQGFDVGGADGLPGFKTRRSIGAWQEKNGQAATCFPDSGLVKALR
ncbi:lytic murein transglycosylase [Mesorhizobium sp. NBSH29]|nr:lytic murein transglycosylase [Mesorhizobium sp. NBSH29]